MRNWNGAARNGVRLKPKPPTRARRSSRWKSEVQSVERRLQEWTLQAARNKDAREAKRSSIDEKREETARLEAEHAQSEASS